MFCTKCGQPVDGDDKFCRACGSPVKKSNVTSVRTSERRTTQRKSNHDNGITLDADQPPVSPQASTVAQMEDFSRTEIVYRPVRKKWIWCLASLPAIGLVLSKVGAPNALVSILSLFLMVAFVQTDIKEMKAAGYTISNRIAVMAFLLYPVYICYRVIKTDILPSQRFTRFIPVAVWAAVFVGSILISISTAPSSDYEYTPRSHYIY